MARKIIGLWQCSDQGKSFLTKVFALPCSAALPQATFDGTISLP
jgi:hypothetical protein